tara:strand:+ start:2671 stop:3693 length:1023 start_codon:yes stop_codon:yes gene_type:complete
MRPIEKKLRKVIREEIIKALITERFGSQILSKLHTATQERRKGAEGRQWLDNKHNNKAAFKALSKAYDIMWDKITDKDIKKSNKLTGKGLEIIVAQKDGSVSPTSGWRSSGFFQKGQMLGVSMNGKRVWMGGGYYNKTARTGQGSRQGNFGLDVRGHNKLDQLMKLGDIKPIVLHIDYKAGGDAGELRASREEARAGALALKSAGEVSADNKRRYKDIMKKAAGAKGVEPLKKMFEEVSKLYQEAIVEATSKLKDGFVNPGWTTNLSAASRAFDDMFRYLKEFMEQVEHDKKYPDSYYKDSKDAAARSMHQEYKNFKKTWKQLKTQAKDKKMWKKIESRY